MGKFYKIDCYSYSKDLREIREYLESHGDLDTSCSMEQLEKLYRTFSEEHCAFWLIPDKSVLNDFAMWLDDIE